MIRVNLIPLHRRETRRRRVRVACWLGACALYAAAGLAVCGVASARAGGDEGDAVAELARLAVEVEQAQAEAGRLESELAAAELSLAAGRAVAGQPDWSILLAGLAQQQGEDVALRTCTLASLPPRAADQQFTLRVGGLARSQLSVSRFVLRLESLGVFDNVQLLETGRVAFRDGDLVSFRLECAMAGEGGTR